jgi:amino acid adenylation domain-containing protein
VVKSEPQLCDGFIRSYEQSPDRPAINVGREVTYRELGERAKCLAAALQSKMTTGGGPLTAVFAYRSETAYAAILGTLMAGHGYVPLNRTFPVDRTRLMLRKSMARSIIVDLGSEAQLKAILTDLDASLLVICPDRQDVNELAAIFPQHRILGGNDLCAAENWKPVSTLSNSIAYLLFTSGSTGEPKGVMVSNGNVIHYVEYVTQRYQFTSTDRVSQMFDLTFDLSAHDMFVAWHSGACVCCPTQKQAIKPGAFINDARLSVWFSVPSTAIFMRRLGMLKPAMYPTLRLSLFCGEALPIEVARDWAIAAPNSIIENLYGPTELTIACTAYRWDNDKSPAECDRGLVPIGQPFDDMEALVVDSNDMQVPIGSVGELLMSGPQLSLGYWLDEKRTSEAFVSIPERRGTYYKTGDRVRWGGPDKPLVYLGRLDSQIKVLGHRVELGEIEAAIRKQSGLDGVIAFGWPTLGGSAEGIEVFLQAEEFDVTPLIEKLRKTLAPYMVPKKIRFLNRFPLKSNGKFDRTRLLEMLQSGG